MKKEKRFFETPGKAIVTIICFIPLLAIFIAGIVFIVSLIIKGNSIGAEGARKAAFADAGISASDANFVDTDFEFDDGHFVYEVSFYANYTEYEYLIKASDGTILEREPYVIPQNISAATNTEIAPTTEAAAPKDTTQATEAATTDISTGNPNTGSRNVIDVEEAKTIALNHAGFSASEVTLLKAELDNDDLHVTYDIEFRNGFTEYEYEINAETGKIIKYDVEFAD
ncbi:MAG: PepSY domain-containing protein [Clostridium sp.]|nr:PepSY domain-containing protein [Clostridium sp.]